jgi:hypothetical protein
MTAALCIAGYFVIAAGLLFVNHRGRTATLTPDPLLPPDSDYPTVEMAAIPPVPLPAWDDFDEVMFRWFAEGSAR